jgi:hypothetical protein
MLYIFIIRAYPNSVPRTTDPQEAPLSGSFLKLTSGAGLISLAHCCRENLRSTPGGDLWPAKQASEDTQSTRC